MPAVPARRPTDREVGELYDEAQTRIAALVLAALASGQLGVPAFRRARAAEARAILARVTQLAVPIARDAVEAAYGTGVGLVGERSVIGLIQHSIVRALGDNLAGKLEQIPEIVGRQVEGILRREGLRVAVRQTVREVPGEFASQQMRRDLMRRGIAGFVDRAGRRWQMNVYARMVVRTTTNEAQNRGVADAMRARGRSQVRVMTSGDRPCHHHPKNPDHPCRKLAGETLSLVELEGGPGLPGWHPNCNHFILPAPEPRPHLEVV